LEDLTMRNNRNLSVLLAIGQSMVANHKERLARIKEVIAAIQSGTTADATDEQLASDVWRTDPSVRGEESWTDFVRLIRKAAGRLHTRAPGYMPNPGMSEPRRRAVVHELLAGEAGGRTDAAQLSLGPRLTMGEDRRKTVVRELEGLNKPTGKIVRMDLARQQLEELVARAETVLERVPENDWGRRATLERLLAEIDGENPEDPEVLLALKKLVEKLERDYPPERGQVWSLEKTISPAEALRRRAVQQLGTACDRLTGRR
jgi:hypothetical protein